MTDLPDPIDQAAHYHDVNLKRLIAWFIDGVAITFDKPKGEWDVVAQYPMPDHQANQVFHQFW